jgi:mannonate dehydratase
VKVETSRPGLYGLGCGTFTQRPSCVVEAVETYLDPFLRGRNVSEIEDIFLAAQVSSYWRNGPVLNNALSGVDQALWDIKGKMAGMPVYDLLGGKCRKAVPVYVHASGDDIPETIEDAKKYMKQGFKYVRLQCSVAGQSTYGTGKGGDYVGAGKGAVSDKNVDGPTDPKSLFDPEAYMRIVPKLFAAARKELGDEIELLHDVHERVPPSGAIQLAKALEPYRLFFLEDILPPEEMDHFRLLRNHTSTPIAMGELFTNQAEYLPLIKDRLIDFIRIHMSDVGGITPMRKIAHLCDFFGVRLALHGPGDTSPIGMAANVAMNLANMNFGIQEWHMDHLGVTGEAGKAMREVFSGMCDIRDGMAWATEVPGLGVDIDEEAAARYPWDSDVSKGQNPCLWPAVRKPDGSIVRP